MSKLIMVETISTFRLRYVVEVPDNTPEVAEDDIRNGNIENEFSQKHLGEQIISSREITFDEYLKTFDEDNDYLKSWETEQKTRYIHVHED